MKASDSQVSFHPWQLGLEPPAGTYFELGGEGGGGEGGGEGAATAVAEPVAAPVEGGAGGGEGGGEGAGDGVEYLTPDDIATLVRENAGTAFAEMLQNAERQQQERATAAREAAARAQADQPPPWDPFDQESVDRYVEWRAQQLVSPLAAQLKEASAFVHEGQLAAGRTEAETMLDGFHEELGDFDHGRTILQAAAYMRQGLEPEQALAQAATEQAAYEQTLEARGAEKFKTAGQALADAGIEPAGGAGAAAEVTEPLTGAGQRVDYKQAARASLARMGRGPGVGEPA